MDWERIIDTIERIVVTGGGNKSDLSKMLGVRSQYLSDIKSGKSKNPGSDFTLALINKLGLSPEWLETGKGDVFQPKLKIKDAVLLAKYGPILEEFEKILLVNKFDSNKVNSLETRLSVLEERLSDKIAKCPSEETEDGASYTAESEPEYGEEETALIVAFHENVAAGPPVGQSEDGGWEVAVPRRFIKTKPEDYYVLQVQGNSMIDAFIPDGSVVLIRWTDVPRDGVIQVVRIDDRVTLKRMKEGEDHSWTLCYEDGTGRAIPLGEDNRVQGDFVAVLPPSTQPRMRGE